MFIKIVPENKSGRKRLAYYSGHRKNGTVKHSLVQWLGYLDELQALYDDPVSHFKAEARRLTQEEKERQVSLSVSTAEHFHFAPGEGTDCTDPEVRADRILSYGVLPLLKLYHELEIDYFWNNRRRYTKALFNHNSIFRLLVCSRILAPDSKLGTWQARQRLAGDVAFSADDVYRSLAFFSRHKDALIDHLGRMVERQYGRDTGLLYYDVTNYYWEVDAEDELRRRGVSKEHRPDPIVQMGLFMDADGIPLSYGLFPGNTTDVATFRPLQQTGRTIYVADRGMMSGMNVASILLRHSGYVISSSVRTCTAELQAFILKQEGYVHGAADGDFRYKSRLTPVERWVTDSATGGKRKVTVNERQVVFFSRAYQQKARHERMKSIEKAQQAAGGGQNTVLNNHAGRRFLKKSIFDGASGERVEAPEFSVSLDTELLQREEALDGYYLICTNVVGTEEGEPPFAGRARFRRDNLFELNRPVDDVDIIDMYRGLWRIEECFRITKTHLEARPVYVRTRDSIEAHFLTCFVSLLLLRLLEKRTGGTMAVGRMVDSLRQALLGDIEGQCFMNLYCDPVIQDIGAALDIDMSRKYYAKADVRALFAAVKKI
ncbi:IS1634 family transposase [Parasphaerochaeta coccoides]|uniref:Transposase IS4 family protein n=1 Tax=Parasphaerochaeta coccoides (strain ATCC BAA-1237 / DSM 17374 / SPN1) TaxID=760011 RepID=F4GKR8_PARC1|nr:IS1634 family transposase [Parasphaerochaeta coccoides]AEC01477.1 transposase IS4 family protein [Parasphaerochaeta coccoides DSM 17374]